MRPRNHSLAFLAAWREKKTFEQRQGGCYPNLMSQKQEERRIPPVIYLAAFLGVLLATTVVSPMAWADWFGTGDNRFEIEFVTIGDPGNPADTTGDPNPAGSVSYIYRIGKYEISEQMITKANAASAEAGEPLGITTDNRGPDKPATSVSWFNAARFVN